MAPDALVVALGRAARAAVELLVDQGVLARNRCLLGLFHPSGANGWRVRQYEAQRPALSEAVTRLRPS